MGVISLAVRLQALAEVFEALGEYDGGGEFAAGMAAAYRSAAKEIRLLLGSNTGRPGSDVVGDGHNGGPPGHGG